MTLDELTRSYEDIMYQFYTEERTAEDRDDLHMEAWLIDEAVFAVLCKMVRVVKGHNTYQLRGTEIRFEKSKGIQLLLCDGRVIKSFQDSTEDHIEELLAL